MKKLSILLCLGALLVGAIYGARVVRRAAQDRVTLNVRNAALPDVVRSLRWQTWENILVASGAKGSVTLHVRNVPLRQVLGMIAEQINGEWNAIYSVAESPSRRALESALIAGTNGAPGWSNLNVQLHPPPAFLFSRNAAGDSEEVTWCVSNKPAADVALQFSRFGKLKVLTDDNAVKNVSLSFKDVPVDQAVRTFAAELGRKAEQWYLLSSHGTPRMPVPPPGNKMTPAQLDGPLKQAFEEGGPVTIPLGDGPPGGFPPLGPIPLEDNKPMTQVMDEVGQRMLDSTRNLTPEQRAERLRNLRKLPPPPTLN